MPTTEKLGDGSRHDKVTEKRMAELLGTTPKALQRKRERSVIPATIWAKIDGRIMYSIWRYDEWLESQGGCPPELILPESPSVSDYREKKSDPSKRLLSRKKRVDPQQNKLYILK